MSTGVTSGRSGIRRLRARSSRKWRLSGIPDAIDRRFYEMKYNTLRDKAGRRIGAYQFAYDVAERLAPQERLSQAEEALGGAIRAGDTQN
jgi:hypothetical protein